MFWDQNTMMPPGGAAARARHGRHARSASLHARETDPELGRLLDALEPWAAGGGPRLRRRAAGPLGAARLREGRPRARRPRRRDHAREGASGSRRGRRRSPPTTSRRFRDALARHVELRHALRRAASTGHEHPYDVAARRLRARPDDRRAAAAVRRAARRARPARRRHRRPEQPRNDGVFARPVHASRPSGSRCSSCSTRVGYDPDHWRLDPSLHPFAQSLAPDRRPPDHEVRRVRLRRRALLRAARVRPRALRGVRRPAR